MYVRGSSSADEYRRNDTFFYKGIVVDDNDPQENLRLKVFIPEISNQPLEDWLNIGDQKIMNFPGSYDALTSKVLEEIRNGLGQELNDALAQSGNSSNPGQNVSEEEDLLARLAPNSNDPLFYKGFRLTLQYITNDGELTQTRVLGLNETNGVSLATELSFTNSPEVLVQEMQFQIDNYNLIFVSDPNISIEDQLDTIDLEGFSTIIPSTDIEEIEIPGLPPRFTAKQIRQLKRKDRRSDRKERREARQAGEITRREARKDRKQDRKERKQKAKDRRRNRIRRKER